jgi:DNA polymerase
MVSLFTFFVQLSACRVVNSMSVDRNMYTKAVLQWHLSMGLDECIEECPVDRRAVVLSTPFTVEKFSYDQTVDSRAQAQTFYESTVQKNNQNADDCHTLSELKGKLESMDCPLKRGARTTVFSDGNPRSRIMLIGEAPGRDEDMQGVPFVGRSGKLLDKILNLIGMDRQSDDPDHSVYITNVLPWRPLENRTPSVDEIVPLLPFVHQHIRLINPAILVLVGGIAAKYILGTNQGITRLRGIWSQYEKYNISIPVMPVLHPAYLLRSPLMKRQTWQDFLDIQEKIEQNIALKRLDIS